MGNGYADHPFYDHPHNLLQRSNFLPLICRLSMKDVKLQQHYKNQRSNSSAEDPSSPKVSCIGQVKRNNKVVGFIPTPQKFITNSSTKTSSNLNAHQNHVKYTKLKKLFSGKNLIPSAAAPTTTKGNCVKQPRSGSRSCRSVREMKRDANNCVGGRKRGEFCSDVVLNIGELDPPLPVVKRVPSPAGGREEVNLWKRRGVVLKSLKIDQIQLANNSSHPPTTV